MHNSPVTAFAVLFDTLTVIITRPVLQLRYNKTVKNSEGHWLFFKHEVISLISCSHCRVSVLNRITGLIGSEGSAFKDNP